MSDAALEVDSLSVSYVIDGMLAEAVTDVSFDLRKGEILGIVGESGCGKSTLAGAIMGLLPANGRVTGGSIRLNGRELRTLTPSQWRAIRGSELATVYQDPLTSLNPTLTIGTQLRDALAAHATRRLKSREWRAIAADTLQQVGIPDAASRLDRYPHEFSGGMRQRVMVGLALLLKPSVLLLDEPTSSLDVTIEAQILELIGQLRETYGTSILFISHDLGVVAQTCDRVIVMYAGQAVEEASVDDLFAHPRHPYTEALLASVPSHRRRTSGRLVAIPGRVPGIMDRPSACRFADRCSYATDVCRAAAPNYVAVNGTRVRCVMYDPMSGWASASGDQGTAGPDVTVALRRPDKPPSPRPWTSGTPTAGFQPAPDAANIVTVTQLRTQFGSARSGISGLVLGQSRPVRAVDGVDLDIHSGEILGLVGESGSGKTTLARTIVRLVRSTSGSIRIDGTDITAIRGRELARLRRSVQMIFQDPYSSLSPRLRVSYQLTEPYRIHHIPEPERQSVVELLDMVGLPPEIATKFPHELSGGQARRVGIARAMSLRPRLLIADEPTSGLDVSAAAGVLNLMRDLSRSLGITYLIITHNLNVVGYVADRVAVMYLAQIVEIGPTGAIFDAPAHPYTRALLSSIAEPDPNLPRRHRMLLPGEIPSPQDPPSGCRFHTRCPFARERCSIERPGTEWVASDHSVACHFWREIGPPPAADELRMHSVSGVLARGGHQVGPDRR